MNLYNIHIHNVLTGNIGDNIYYILNTYPDDFAQKKVVSDKVYYSCGIHPWYSQDWHSQKDILKQIVTDKHVLAVGEAGLDKLKGPSMDIQIEAFEYQIRLAESVNKPMIIHCVKAWDELIGIYKKIKPSIPCILHGFRGNDQQAVQLNKLGFYFSIGEYFNEKSLMVIPLSKIFCETDTSDISINKIYSHIADKRNIPLEQFVNILACNSHKIFKI